MQALTRTTLWTGPFPTVSSILAASTFGDQVQVNGWIRTIRRMKNVSFLELSDGSCSGSLQVVVKPETIQGLHGLITGSSVQVSGSIVRSPGGKQPTEMQATSVKMLGGCEEKYPIQKKDHSLEFLRTIPHLRMRASLFSALARIRSRACKAMRDYLQDNEYVEVHAPVLTFSDCEGAGETFTVKDSEKFFGQSAHLTVSSQFHAEIAASSLPRVFTFGPIFRAEKHNTVRHMSEFWMLEPEIAFMSSTDELLDAIEDFLQASTLNILKAAQQDLEACLALDPGLEQIWRAITEPFARVSYTDAIGYLVQHDSEFKVPARWGMALQLEHEKFLIDNWTMKPTFVTDYPKDVKSFYMRMNDDGRTVACCDLLVPKLAEIVGGSLREERLDRLTERMDELGMDKSHYSWYLDLRRYGSVPHGGYGLGFDRFLQYLTGISNIRDVCMIPRSEGSHSF